MSEARELATVTDYDGLIDAMRARAEELDVPREAIDAVSGLQAGYSAKLLAPVPIKKLGLVSLGPMLQALGLALVVVVDTDSAGRFASQMSKRRRNDRSNATDQIVVIKRSRRSLRKIGRIGRKNRWEKATQKQRAKWAKRMSRMRWARVRFAERRRARLSANPSTANPTPAIRAPGTSQAVLQQLVE